MATFAFEHRADDLPDRAFVDVDDKYNVVIIRTDEGVIVDLYPKDWDCPVATMGVCDNDVTKLENQNE